MRDDLAAHPEDFAVAWLPAYAPELKLEGVQRLCETGHAERGPRGSPAAFRALARTNLIRLGRKPQ